MTNPPIPPAVVEAMARAMLIKAEAEAPGFGIWDDLPEDEREHLFTLAQASLSAALATGSVVICTPELKALMARADMMPAELEKYGCIIAYEDHHLVEAALAFARAHQEDKR